MKLRLTAPLVKEFIIAQAGEDAHKVIRCLGTGVTDEQISKKTGLRVNDIRAILNRLHYIGVIVYSKEKAKRSNWYTYTWFLKKARITELLGERYKEELGTLKEKLDMEQNYVFFKCSDGCERLPFELAFEYDFKCPECGNTMDQLNNNKEKTEIRKKIKDIIEFLNS